MMQLVPMADGSGYGFLHRADPQRSPRATVVMLNAGLIHRVGPFRMNIELAERLARHGIDLFRFDFPAVGDAPAGGGNRPEDRVRLAMDTVTAITGSDRFIVGGVCSAADLAWKLPALDARVRGLLLLDPCAVRGPWFHWAQLRHFVSRPISGWGRMLRHRLHGWGKGAATPAGRDWPSEREFIAGNQRMTQAGIGMYALYTAGVTDYFLHPQQIRASFPDNANDPRLRLRFRPDVDHIFFVPSQRAEILDDITSWLDGWLPASTPPVSN